MSHSNSTHSISLVKILLLVPFFMVSMLFLSSCAVISKSDCLYTSWFDKGRTDGTEGKDSDLFYQYVDACSKHGVRPDEDDYFNGYKEGLSYYCTRENGYNQGRGGNRYQYVCPGETEPDFLNGYRYGQRVHHTEDEILSIDNQIQYRYNQIDKLNEDIDEYEKEIVDDDTDQEDRKDLLRAISKSNKDIGQYKAEIELLLDQKVTAIADYRDAVDSAKAAGFSEYPRY